MNRLARLSVLVAAASAAAFAHAQTGNLYELPDYEYFEEQAPTPTPTPAPASTPSSAATPSASGLNSSPPSAPLISGAPTPSASSVASGAVGAMAAAREDAKALATPQRAAAAQLPTTADLTTAIPHYSSAPLPHQAYMDDPDALAASGASAASGNDPWRTIVDPSRPTVRLGPDELARAKAIEDDPTTYAQGEALGGATGSCTPLPPSTGGQGFYEATCNAGTQVEQGVQSCTIPLAVSIVRQPAYEYFCLNGSEDPDYDCATFTSAPVCQAPVLSSPSSCFSIPDFPYIACLPDFYSVTCSAPVSGQPPTNGTAHEVVERRDESQCQRFASSSDCSVTGEVCTSSDPVTRVIDGVSVTKSCWAWSRSYQCTTFSQASDCQQLESNASCTFASETCLDDPPNGACQVRERTYRCPIPGNQATGGEEFICSGDLYCINGDCEPIVREASTEFKDALVGLHALGQANAEFDETTLTLFSGERETCHKPVFGLINCCAGKSSGLLTTAAGGAALAGGPLAIAALATPFLTLFACSAEEKQLDVKDRMGLCHRVGSYCSSSVLGICKTRRTAYCCFESKLTRILQEQGRPQIGMPWGSPKREQCTGFTVEQFSRLDLSVMDFTEVYAEFVDAAKLPDEVQATQQIQQRIVEYYEQRATAP